MLRRRLLRLGAGALKMSQETLVGLPREHRPQIVVRVARLLGRSAAARHAGLSAVREFREAFSPAKPIRKHQTQDRDLPRS
jgi:hypothetical protein